MLPDTNTLPYSTLPLTPEKMFEIYGPYCVAFEQAVFNAMRHLLQDQYQGGAYELRQYPNGAVALVLPESDKVTARYGMAEESLTFEGASFAANIIALGQLLEVAHQRSDHTNQQRQHYQYYGILDALRGSIDVMVDPTHPEGHRAPTDEERHQLSPIAKSHADQQAIMRLID